MLARAVSRHSGFLLPGLDALPDRGHNSCRFRPRGLDAVQARLTHWTGRGLLSERCCHVLVLALADFLSIRRSKWNAQPKAQRAS